MLVGESNQVPHKPEDRHLSNETGHCVISKIIAKTCRCFNALCLLFILAQLDFLMDMLRLDLVEKCF